MSVGVIYLGRCHICGRRLSWWRRLRKKLLCWRLSCRREWEFRALRVMRIGGL